MSVTDTDTDLGFEFVEPDDIPAITRQNSKAARKINAFVESGRQAARINVPEGTKVESVAGGLKTYAQRHRAPVHVFTRNGGVYMEAIPVDEVEDYWNDFEAKSAERAAAKAAKNGDAS